MFVKTKLRLRKTEAIPRTRDRSGTSLLWQETKRRPKQNNESRQCSGRSCDALLISLRFTVVVTVGAGRVHEAAGTVVGSIWFPDRAVVPPHNAAKGVPVPSCTSSVCFVVSAKSASCHSMRRGISEVRVVDDVLGPKSSEVFRVVSGCVYMNCH